MRSAARSTGFRLFADTPLARTIIFPRIPVSVPNIVKKITITNLAHAGRFDGPAAPSEGILLWCLAKLSDGVLERECERWGERASEMPTLLLRVLWVFDMLERKALLFGSNSSRSKEDWWLEASLFDGDSDPTGERVDLGETAERVDLLL